MCDVRCSMLEAQAKACSPAATRRSAGAAMLLVVIALAFAAVLSLSFLRSQGPTLAIASNHDKHARARAIAESGLAYAIEYVKANPDWRTIQPHGIWMADVSYEGGSFSVYGTDDDGDLGDDPSDPLELAVVGQFDGVSHRATVQMQVASAPFSMEAGTIVADGTPQTIALQGSYNRPVVVCSPQIVDNTEPLVVRVDTVTGGSFRVWLQRCDDGAVLADTVHYMVMEEGVYNVDGVLCEARRYESTQTEYYPNWSGVRRTFGNAYDDPVVFGQVMTARDADWSVFWCRGSSESNAPSSAHFYIGKHVGEDPDTDRLDETIGYIVFEEGRHTINGVGVDVHLSGDAIMGVTNGSGTDSTFEQSFDNPPEVVVVSQSGMDGNNGSWAMLWGAAAVTTSRARLIVDEDLLRDPERSHTSEQVGVIAFERPPDAMSEQTILQYEFDQAEFTPHAVAHWRLDEPAGGGGGVAAYDQLKTNSYARIDSYDSTRGPYGPANNAEAATVSTNSTGSDKLHIDSHSRVEGNAYVGVGGNTDTVVEVDTFAYLTGHRYAANAPAILPDLTPPGDMPASSGNTTYSGSGTEIIDDDQRYNHLTLSDDRVLRIDGHVRIQVDGHLRLYDRSRIEVPAGSSLTIWVDKNVEVYNDASMNGDSTATDRLTVYAHGSGRRFRVSSDGTSAGSVFVQGDFRLDNNAVFYGRVLAGEDVELHGNSLLHADVALPTLGIATMPAVEEVIANDGGYRGDAAGGAASPAGLTTGGTAATFDGNGDYIEVSHSDTYLLDNGTIALWFHADSTAGTQGLFCKDATGYGEGGHLTVRLEGGRVKARLQSATQTQELTSGPISDGTWTHMAFAFGAEGMALYINGVEEDSADYGGGLSMTSGGTGNREAIVIGADTAGASAGGITPLNNYFAGRIDDVRLYDHWCSASQAATVMSGGDPGTRWSDTLVMDTATYGSPLHLRVDNPAHVTWDSGVLRFDSATHAVSLIEADKVRTAIEQSGAFSVVLRFRRADPATTSTPSIVFGMSAAMSASNVLIGQDDDAYEARARTGSTGASGLLMPNFESTNALDHDGFIHLALTYDGSTLRCYIDGQLDHSQPLSGGLSSWSGALPVVVGSTAGGQFPWLGEIDSARVYDQALATSQVMNLSQGLPLNAVDNSAGAVIWIESR